jgi:predicted ferric reductase
MANQLNTTNIDDVKPVFSFGGFTLILFITFVVTLITIMVLPLWLPGLTTSLSGEAPKAFWYLSRGSAITAYMLLWLSMMLGSGITNKLGSLWPGLPSTIELHEYTSILGLAFGIFHGLILLGDKFMGYTLAQVLVPFTSSYQTLAVGFGQTALYIWAILDISFYIRKVIGKKAWRAIHFASFLTFVSVLYHALISGSDSMSMAMQYTYLGTGSLLIFMVLYRILSTLAHNKEKKLRLQSIPPKIPVQ